MSGPKMAPPLIKNVPRPNNQLRRQAMSITMVIICAIAGICAFYYLLFRLICG